MMAFLGTLARVAFQVGKVATKAAVKVGKAANRAARADGLTGRGPGGALLWIEREFHPPLRGIGGELERVADSAPKRMERLAVRLGDYATEVAQRETPKKSGAMRAAWRARVRQTSTGAELEVTNAARHARFVIDPTRPHTIRARSGGYLVFQTAGGQLVFRRQVQHPGTKGNDIPDRVRRAVIQRGQQLLAEEARDLAGDIKKAFR
jgi:hypothetical protein